MLINKKLDVQSFFKTMKETQRSILDFIENEENAEENYQNLINFCKNQKIQEDYNLFKSTLYILKNIANNHHRNQDFISKIEKILMNYKDSIKQTFSNYDIFNIFKKNKLILLFLFENEFVTPDKSIAFMMTKTKFKKRFYPQFFYPEFKEIFNDKLVREIDPEKNDLQSDEFKEKRKIGENDDHLCELIRNDSIDEFTELFQKDSIHIKPSIFETNLFLLKNQNINVIEYAAFFGSSKILQYLLSLKLTLESLVWTSSIHSQSLEIIHLIENNAKHLMQKDTYKSCLIEIVKCHHAELLVYFKTNFDQRAINLIEESLKYYNFIELIVYRDPECFNFYRFCQYDYLILVDNYLTNQNNLFTKDILI